MLYSNKKSVILKYMDLESQLYVVLKIWCGEMIIARSHISLYPVMDLDLNMSKTHDIMLLEKITE